uniref:Uncharacterized protein n=1 Tax=Rhizophora mucronata TaxID=61149 RepID=A0A2P2NI78_RHIMU
MLQRLIPCRGLQNLGSMHVNGLALEI